MARPPAPWNHSVPVIQPDGTASPEFLRWLSQQLGQNEAIGGAVPASRQIIAGVGLSGGGSLAADRTIDLDNTAVAPGGAFTNANITVDAQGRITAAANGSPGVNVSDEGSNIALATRLNFIGSGVTAADAGGGVVSVTIPGGGGSSEPWYWAPPAAADFTGTYSGDANNLTLTDDADVGLIVESGAFVTGDEQRLKTIDLPSAGATDWTATIRGIWTWPLNLSGSMGLCIYESGTGRVAHIVRGNDGTIYSWRGNNLTTWTAGIGSATNTRQPNENWLRIVYTHSTTTYSMQYSADGKSWIELGTVAAGTAFTTRADKVGVSSQVAASSSLRAYMTVDHWGQSW